MVLDDGSDGGEADIEEGEVNEMERGSRGAGVLEKLERIVADKSTGAK